MVSNMICGWKTCHTITLANNSIGDEAARQLCQAFSSMPQPALSQLSLAYNFLTDASADDLATLITSCTSLDALDVEGNMLSVKGIKGLAYATSQSRISALHLSHNTGDPARLAGSTWEAAFVSGRLKTLEIAQHFPEQAQVRICQQCLLLSAILPVLLRILLVHARSLNVHVVMGYAATKLTL